MLMLLAVLLTGNSCKKAEDNDFFRLKIVVVDKDDNPVEGAAVKIFFDENEMLDDIKMLEEVKTDRGGNAYFTLVHPFYTKYYLDVAKDEMNNWRGKNSVELQRGILNEHKIYIEESLETMIGGKKEKEWVLVKYLFNGDEGVGCTFNTRNVFFSYGFYDVYATDSDDCSRPNAFLASDRWVISPDRKAIHSGSLINPVVRQIKEINGKRMILVRDLTQVVIEETYEIK
jgi:hypothetical protein